MMQTWATASVDGSKRAARAAGKQLSLEASGRLRRSMPVLARLRGEPERKLSVDVRVPC
jgi:hypothetical protein